MHSKRSDPTLVERAVVLQVLREDHDDRWSRAELQRAASDLPPEDIESAIEYLASQGVVELDGDQVWASLGARHLDELGLITI
jgi:hypothetical protein